MAEIQMSVCSVLLFLVLSGCVFLSVWLVVTGESVASVLLPEKKISLSLAELD